MLAFLASIRDLCLFRRGPEDLPYSPALLIALLIASVVIEGLFDAYRGVQPLLMPVALAGTLATLGVLFLVLRGRRKPERFMQTALALVTTSLLFELIVLPLSLLVMPFAQAAAHATNPPNPTQAQALALLAMFAFAIWQICISVNILRRALEIPIVGGVLVLLLLVCVNWIVVSLGAHLVGVT
ncbi:MAG: hypothetical protein ACREPY_02555 [Rhodanobacteraceae bacterium]